MSNLDNLSPIDFEELCRDIAQADTGKRFSAFGPGADGGVDGRCSEGDDRIILQCKHYLRSSFSKLESSLKNEVKKISEQKPNRYLLFTSQSLTPKKSNKLAIILGEYLLNLGDIWGRKDIEAALKRYPEIEKSHMKLWLSSTAVLERILHSGLEGFTQATKKEIVEDARVYVKNDSFDEATDKLEKEKVLIISGPPGVGKTTLAKMITYYYLNKDWRFYAINSLDEGFAKINDKTPTVFFFDDFLGHIELDRQALRQKDSAFLKFVERVGKSKNAKFILTTRAHILEEAINYSERLDTPKIKLSKYILNVETYTREIRSHIFLNHLVFSNFTQEHFAALLQGDWLIKIIDHKNYNPRVISLVSSHCLDIVVPKNYPTYIYDALDKPDIIWKKAYTALNIRSKNLLVSLFFSGAHYVVTIDNLREAFSQIHHMVCSFYGQPTTPEDFETSLRALETGFIAIDGKNVKFINPSVDDFLKAHLDNHEHLKLLPSAAIRADWARNLWSHVKKIFKSNPDIIREFASAFADFASRIDATPTYIYQKREGHNYMYADDLSLSDRVNLLLDWSEVSKQEYFIEKAVSLLNCSSLRLRESDGISLPELHESVCNSIDSEHVLKSDLLNGIETSLSEAIQDAAYIDELVPIVSAIQDYMGEALSEKLQKEIDDAVKLQFDEPKYVAGDWDCAYQLNDQLENLDELSRLTGHNSDSAKEIISNRIQEIEERQDHSEQTSPNLPKVSSSKKEFSDADIKSLFSNLLKR